METKYRTETDCLGEVLVEADKFWKSTTQRSLDNFKIGSEKMPSGIIQAFALLKAACAMANNAEGKISSEQEALIVDVCQKILSGKLQDQFPLSVWQTGSGTQSNMNVNEVIAQYGNMLAGKDILHPNDTVNASQSSNDTFPAAMHIMAASEVVQILYPALDYMAETIKELEEKYHGIIKIGRTHLQDATPLYFHQELSGYRSMLEHSRMQLESALQFVYELAIGATAVGSGINCPEGFDVQVCAILQEMCDLPFIPDPNKFHALTSKDACVFLSGALKGLAANLLKIANDIRWLASGPRCAIGEIELPANEPGSSIMPGKVNPTQCEALSMVAVQVMGNDAAIGFAASQGNFELNVYMPLIAYNLDQAIILLADAMTSFTTNALKGLKVNADKMQAYVENSLMLVTCLSPVIGYEKASHAARYAYEKDLSLKEAILELGLLDEKTFLEYVKPEKMVRDH